MQYSTFKKGTGSRLAAPADGIMSSQRPRGWLGQAWLELLTRLGRTHASRVARGRSLARGRVRDLWFSPGLANAEVYDQEECRSTLRLRTFKEDEWQIVLDALANDLRHIAALLEGRLPQAFVTQLAEAGVKLVPTNDEYDGDCTCGDYILPCAHLCAVHTVLADALDGEPFLLLTLRGRTREQILSSLRRRWGDKRPVDTRRAASDEAPPDATDWFASPAPLHAMRFAFSAPEASAVGLRALGPPPGEDDLIGALEPLYAAGSTAAYEIAIREREATEDSDDDVRRRRRRRRVGVDVAPPRPAGLDVQTAADTAEEHTLTERLVDLLAELSSAKSSELADRMAVDKLIVRNELIALEKLGIVFRTGATRGTRWHLG
ncbi:MAG: putative Zn finger protein [Myxococcota bacterium]|jgi:uncharacterized Zn finger protein